MGAIITTGEKSGVKIEEYQGVYSLASQNKSDDKFYPVWAKYKKGKDAYQDKDWPVKVILGDKETAKGVLRMLFKEIDGGATTQTQKPPVEKKPEPTKNTEPDVKDFDDGIPF